MQGSEENTGPQETSERIRMLLHASPSFLSYFSTKDVSEQDHSIAMLAMNVNKENEWRFGCENT